MTQYPDLFFKNFAAPLEAEGGFYSIPCLECSDKDDGETIKSLNARMSQPKYDVSRYSRCNTMYTVTCWNKIILLIGKMHHMSSII